VTGGNPEWIISFGDDLEEAGTMLIKKMDVF
jgi:hypothetical protein